MKTIESFLLEIDQKWRLDVGHIISLKIIGSAALLLQVNYERGTKDSDVLETVELTLPIKEKLLELAGKGSPLSKSHRMYLDVVSNGIPFLPPDALFHTMPSLNRRLKHFEIEVLDVADVVVSKLMRFNANDASDIAAMVTGGWIKHKVVINRFLKAIDGFLMDARAEDLPNTIRNLHTVERDYFRVPDSAIELPDWL